MITVVLRVDFKPYTSWDWLFEKMTNEGLRMVPAIDTDGSDGQFVLVGKLNGYYALVGTLEEKKLQIFRGLRLIPDVIKVEELDTRGA